MPAMRTIAASKPFQPASIDTTKPFVASRKKLPWAIIVSLKGKMLRY